MQPQVRRRGALCVPVLRLLARQASSGSITPPPGLVAGVARRAPQRCMRRQQAACLSLGPARRTAAPLACRLQVCCQSGQQGRRLPGAVPQCQGRVRAVPQPGLQVSARGPLAGWRRGLGPQGAAEGAGVGQAGPAHRCRDHAPAALCSSLLIPSPPLTLATPAPQQVPSRQRHVRGVQGEPQAYGWPRAAGTGMRAPPHARDLAGHPHSQCASHACNEDQRLPTAPMPGPPARRRRSTTALRLLRRGA